MQADVKKRIKSTHKRNSHTQKENIPVFLEKQNGKENEDKGLGLVNEMKYRKINPLKRSKNKTPLEHMPQN